MERNRQGVLGNIARGEREMMVETLAEIVTGVREEDDGPSCRCCLWLNKETWTCTRKGSPLTNSIIDREHAQTFWCRYILDEAMEDVI